MNLFCNFKYELITDDTRRAALSRFAGCRRAVFNKALELQNERKAKSEKPIPYLEMAHLLVEWKQTGEMSFLKEAPSQALQQALMDLDRAIKDSFRKKGDPAKKSWPRFKAKDIGDGFRIPQVKSQDIDEPNGRVKLPKLGWVRYRRSRPLAFECADGTLIPGKVKQIHVTKDCGKWFVTFATEFDIPDPVMKEKDVGIDVGIVHAVTLSSGETFDLDIEAIKKLEGQIAYLKRRLSLNQSSRKKLAAKGLAEEFDKKKPSRTRRRLKELIQKKYKRIRCIRQDFHRKTAHALAQEYGCVYVEDLKLRNMTKSARGTKENPGKNVRQKRSLNRSLQRMGLRALRQAIEEKMQQTGGIVVPVPPQNTSRTCPVCGCCDKRNRPTQALFECIRCHYSANADVVGAINVMRKGRMSPSAHDKKRIAREANAAGAGDSLSVSAPSAGTTLSTSYSYSGILALQGEEDVKKMVIFHPEDRKPLTKEERLRIE